MLPSNPSRNAPPELGLPRHAPGAPAPTLDSQKFLRALEFAMRWEQNGGPDQPTTYGITQPFHNTYGDPSHPAGVSHVTPDEAKRLYYGLWQRLNARKPGLTYPDQLARFDTAINRGESSSSLSQDTEHMLAARVAQAAPAYRQGITNRVADLWTEIGSLPNANGGK